MKQKQFSNNWHYAKWCEERFSGKKVANIRIHLNDHHIPSIFRNDFYCQTERLFSNCFSRKFIKDVRENGQRAGMFCCLHREQRKHNIPGRHFHILVEYPDDRSISDVRMFLEKFCTTPRYDANLERRVLITKGAFFVEDAVTAIGSEIYNLIQDDGTIGGLF